MMELDLHDVVVKELIIKFPKLIENMYFDYSSLCLCSSKETRNYCDLWKEIERGYHACLIYQFA